MKTIIHQYDVVVCGGGPSGVAAAISAARAGARTALIEATGCLGGMATNGLVPVFNPFSNGRFAVIRGIGLEIVQRLRQRGSGLRKPDPLPRELPEYDWTGLDAEKLKALLDDMTAEAGVEGRYFTLVTEPILSGSRIKAVRTWSKSGPEEWRGKVFVDCTGDADLAARAGCPFFKGDDAGRMQPSTVCFVISGISPAAGKKIRHKPGFAPILKQATLDGKLRGKLDHHYCLNSVQPTDIAIGCNYKHQLDTDGTSAASLTVAIIEGRQMAHELCAYLRSEIPGCQNAYVSSSASLVGVRETRRIDGEYCMDLQHFLDRRKSTDDIASYGNEVDVHVTGKNTADVKSRLHAAMDTFLKIGEHYGIPYGSLVPKKITNLLVAGRAVSCDRMMHGSVRPMPACFATGQAAGLAGSIAVKSACPVREVPVKKLQQSLLKHGAYIDLPGKKSNGQAVGAVLKVRNSPINAQ